MPSGFWDANNLKEVKEYNEKGSMKIRAWDGAAFRDNLEIKDVRHYTEGELDGMFGGDKAQVEASQKLFRKSYKFLQEEWERGRIFVLKEAYLTKKEYFSIESDEDDEVEQSDPLVRSRGLDKKWVILMCVVMVGLVKIFYPKGQTSLEGDKQGDRKRRSTHRDKRVAKRWWRARVSGGRGASSQGKKRHG